MAFYRCDRGLGFDTSNSTGKSSDVLRYITKNFQSSSTSSRFYNKYSIATKYGNIETKTTSNNILSDIYYLNSNLSSSKKFYHHFDYVIPKIELTKNDIMKDTTIYSITGTRSFVQFGYAEYITLDKFFKYDYKFTTNLDNNVPIFSNYDITLTKSNKNFDNSPIYIYSNKNYNMITCIHYHDLLYSELYKMFYPYVSEILNDIKSSEILNSEYLNYRNNYGKYDMYNTAEHTAIYGKTPAIIYYMYKDNILSLFFQPSNNEENEENTLGRISPMLDALLDIYRSSNYQKSYPNLYAYFKTKLPTLPKFYANSFMFEMNAITGEIITPLEFSKTPNNYGTSTSQIYKIINITENYNGLEYFSNEYFLLLWNYRDKCSISSYNIYEYVKKYSDYTDPVDSNILINNYLYIFINKDGTYGKGAMGTIVLKFSPLLELIFECDLINTSLTWDAYGYFLINQFDNSVDIRVSRESVTDRFFNSNYYIYSRYDLESFELLSENIINQYSINIYHLDHPKKSYLSLVNIFDTDSKIDYFGYTQNKYYHHYKRILGTENVYDIFLFNIFNLYLLNDYDTSYSGYSIDTSNESYTDYYFN